MQSFGKLYSRHQALGNIVLKNSVRFQRCAEPTLRSTRAGGGLTSYKHTPMCTDIDFIQICLGLRNGEIPGEICSISQKESTCSGPSGDGVKSDSWERRSARSHSGKGTSVQREMSVTSKREREREKSPTDTFSVRSFPTLYLFILAFIFDMM